MKKIKTVKEKKQIDLHRTDLYFFIKVFRRVNMYSIQKKITDRSEPVARSKMAPKRLTRVELLAIPDDFWQIGSRGEYFFFSLFITPDSII